MESGQLSNRKTVSWGFSCLSGILGKMKKAVDDCANGKVYAIMCHTAKEASRWLEEYAKEDEKIIVYDTYDALLADHRIDIVYVALPSEIKREWVLKAAQAKKHILCEKPFTNAEEVAEIIRACMQNNVHLWGTTLFMYHPRTKEIKFVMKSGELGDIHHVHGEFSSIFPISEIISHNQEFEPHGALGETGWHVIMAILLAMDLELPTTVLATATYKNRIVESCDALLYFKDPLKIASLHCGFTTSIHQSLIVGGTKKTLIVDDLFSPYYAYPHNHAEITCYKLRDCDGRLEIREVHSPKRDEVNLAERVGELLIRKIRGELDPKLELRYDNFTLFTQKILDAIDKSARKGGVLTEVK